MSPDDKETIKRIMFMVEVTRIAAQVQHACALASGLEDPAVGFDTLQDILNTCLNEMSTYEARMRNEVEFTPEAPEEPSGN